MMLSTSLAEHIAVCQQLEKLLPMVQQVAQQMLQCLQQGGKIFWMGNGGSAADAQHLAAELVGRFLRERRALPSLALTTDSSIVTSVANDYGYDKVFVRQIEAFCRPGDIVVGISTSGSSPNVVAGLKAAKQLDAITVAMTGERISTLQDIADYCLAVPTQTTARIQEAHILLGHILCDYIDQAIS